MEELKSKKGVDPTVEVPEDPVFLAEEQTDMLAVTSRRQVVDTDAKYERHLAAHVKASISGSHADAEFRHVCTLLAAPLDRGTALVLLQRLWLLVGMKSVASKVCVSAHVSVAIYV
jgi:hypothetical protein